MLFAQLVEDATFSYTFFRDLPGALVAYRQGDRAPIMRVAAEDVSFDAAGGGAASYSVGDFAAVSCHDYPTIWDVAASPAVRQAQLRRAIDRLPAGVFAPFRKRVWLGSLDENQLVFGCVGWPAPPFPDPPFPGGARPRVPVLVLDGEFDQATPVADARRAAAAWPDSTYVQVRNTNHVSALADFQGCASGIVRRFLAGLAAGDTSCAGRVPAVEVARFPARLRAAPPARALAGDARGRPRTAAAWVAGAVVGDAFTRWYNLMFGVDGHGLRGGRFTVSGGYYSERPLQIRFHGDRFVAGLAASGLCDVEPHGAPDAGDAHPDRPARRLRPDRARLLDRPRRRPRRSPRAPSAGAGCTSPSPSRGRRRTDGLATVSARGHRHESRTAQHHRSRRRSSRRSAARRCLPSRASTPSSST